MKSKNVKLPVELVEALEKRSGGRTPGEVMLDIYREYELLEGLAASIAAQRKDFEKGTVYERIMRYITDGDEKIKQLQKSVDELKTMLQGLEIYMRKFWKKT